MSDAKVDEGMETKNTPTVDLSIEEETEEDMESDEEAMAEDEEDKKLEAIQEAVALEVREWLAVHGAKLLALEISKKRLRWERKEVEVAIKEDKRFIPMESEVGEPVKKRRRLGERKR